MESYAKRQKKWIKENDIHIGDRVIISRSSFNGEQGWEEVWTSRMDKYIGASTVTIKKIGKEDEGIYCVYNNRISGYWFPYFVLEPIKETKSIEKNENWIPKYGDRVWCIYITDSVTYYDDIYSKAHETMFKNGLIFKTREQVRKVVREIKNIL